MRENYKLTYNVDIVFCIDSTGSMDNILGIVKQNALNLYQDVTTTMKAKNKIINQMRLRVISFKDYLVDKEDAMMMSDFFTLPDDAADFKECVDLIEADGGGDIPEDGLEALAYAIRSDWNQTGIKRRHVIVVWSDAPTHPLGYGGASPLYPTGMPKDFVELTNWWGDAQHGGYMDNSAKRLLLFVPVAQEWSRIVGSWNNVVHIQSQEGEGLQECDYQQVLEAIGNTI